MSRPILAAGVCVGLALTIRAQEASSPQKPLAEMPMKPLMSQVIYPTSDAVFYITSREPKNDADWAELLKKTEMLAESAQIMLRPTHRRDRDRWTKDAQLMIDASAKAVEAARKKDLEALADLNDALYTSCVTCHKDYRPNYGARPTPAADSSRPPSPESRLFFLDIRGGRVVSVNPDGSDLKELVTGHRKTPDGIAVDAEAGHIYWSNMGRANDDDGSVMRVDVNGGNVTTIVPEGGTFTAKQLKLDAKNRKLYWSDREGMRIQRANVDGSRVETLVETGHGAVDRWDAKNWCVGIAVDIAGGKIYWTQKGNDDAGEGRILRANIEIPKGQDPAHRRDVEVLFDGLPEPIDLDLDLATRMIYWTDRGDLPGGNSVARAPMDPPKGFNPWTRTDRAILLEGLREGIGIALDLQAGRMYVTDLGGNVYRANLDGSDKETILTGQGTLTGIAVAKVSPPGS